MKGKLIVIEGTESSGKQTAANYVTNELLKSGIKAVKKSFPNYDSPTGKIIENCLLGRGDKSYFAEGFSNIPPKVAALYYAADRTYNINEINNLLNSGINVILDRYVESNMAYQAAKYSDIKDKINILLWMEQLEFTLLDLPRPDKVIFLYLPYIYREDKSNDNIILKDIEYSYNLMANRYHFDVISCVKDEKIRNIDEIDEEVYSKIKEIVN